MLFNFRSEYNICFKIECMIADRIGGVSESLPSTEESRKLSDDIDTKTLHSELTPIPMRVLFVLETGIAVFCHVCRQATFADILPSLGDFSGVTPEDHIFKIGGVEVDRRSTFSSLDIVKDDIILICRKEGEICVDGIYCLFYDLSPTLLFTDFIPRFETEGKRERERERERRGESERSGESERRRGGERERERSRCG